MTMLRTSNVNLITVLIAVFGFTFSGFIYSANNVSTKKINKTKKISSFSIPHTSLSIKIDGELNDKAWQHALSIPLNIVNYPWHNLPSPVHTEAKIIENGKFLYVSFIADDPHPERIIGFLGDRDTKWGDDLVGIKLDTFNSRRLNYEFFVNPFGVQNDSIHNEVTGDSNALWDGIWQSYGKITAKGYQVEIAIPFRILNFKQSDKEKTWAIELVRMYPRDERLRISHMPIDRNNACWVCQMPEIKGFKDAKIGKNITLTPSTVVSRNENRNIYDNNDPWHANNTASAGLDLRWGITPSTLLNATLNPDFSTVESDTGQLNVNTNFSLFYDEKRTFFLENSDYFSSNFNLVYTRNIADPNYGIKLTGRNKNQSYGLFITDDKRTNFIVPGNTGSQLASLGKKSYAAAGNYRYNINDNFSVGFISTLRSSENYHNIVSGIDGKYRIDESNSVLWQALYSNTLYPTDLFKSFCLSNGCNTPKTTDCIFSECNFTEQVLRTKFNDNISGQAYKLNFKHRSEFWQVDASHQALSRNFRADLGFITKTDYKKDDLKVTKLIYGNDKAFWNEIDTFAKWSTEHNQKNEFIARTLNSGIVLYGPLLSTFNISYIKSNKIGLRQDKSKLTLDNNAHRFNERLFKFEGNFQPTSRIFIGVGSKIGDRIDYSNDRIGKYREIFNYFTINATDHLAFNVYLQNQKLYADNYQNINSYVYNANLADIRISYQFDVRSYLKLNIVYSNVDRNKDNNPFTFINKKERSLSTQLIYSYKLNPQTVFFLGYSDSSYQDDNLSNLKREQRTFFTKISYAWMPS